MRVFGSVVFALFAALSPSLLAQWPSVKTPNVPRNPDGTVNMTAPAPRTPDGHVDISGIWAAGGGGGGRGGRGRAAGDGAGAAGAPAAGAPAAAAGAPAGAAPAGAAPGGAAAGSGRAQGVGASASNVSGTPPLATFGDIGRNSPGGLPLQPWAAELKKKRMSENMKDNADAHCLPIGHMQLHLHPQPRKYLWTPSEIVMIWESNYGLRHIYLDGRQAPAKDSDNQPYWYGYTTGKWEGDTLVATTTHIRDWMWLDVNGTPLTDQATIVERFRRPNFGSLEIDVTIDDPKAFTMPFTVRVNQRIMVDTALLEFICNENEQSSTHYAK